MFTFKQYLLEKESQQNAVTGIHYSHRPDITELSGHAYGKGIRGEESERLKQSKDNRIKNRVYFYPSQGENLPQPESGLGNHAYEAKLPHMLDARKSSPEMAKVAARAKEYIANGEHPSNAFESAVVDSGHHGYLTDSMHVVLNRNVKVKYIGTTKGRNLVHATHDTKPKHQSIINTVSNKDGEHESSMLTPEGHAFWNKHKDSLKLAAPSIKLQYGRVNVNKKHLEDLNKELEKHPNHPL